MKKLLFFLLIFGACFAHAQGNQNNFGGNSVANTVTVCSSGCLFSTINAALASSSCSSGNCIIVPAANTTYTHTLQITSGMPNVTISCPNWSTIITTASAANDVIDVYASGFQLKNCSIYGAAYSGDGSSGETTSQYCVWVQGTMAYSNALIQGNYFSGADSQHGCNLPIRFGNSTSNLQSQGNIARLNKIDHVIGYYSVGYSLLASNGNTWENNPSTYTTNPACASNTSGTLPCGRHHVYVSTSSGNIIRNNTWIGGLNVQGECNTADSQPAAMQNIWDGNIAIGQAGQTAGTGTGSFGAFHASSACRGNKYVNNEVWYPYGYGFWFEDPDGANPTAQNPATTNGCVRSGNTLTMTLQSAISPAPVANNFIQITGDAANTICNGLFPVASVTSGSSFTLTTPQNLVGTTTGTDTGAATVQLVYSRGQDNQVLNNRIYQAGLDGILLYGSTRMIVSGNEFFDCSQQVPGTYANIRLSVNGNSVGATANTITNNNAYGNNNCNYALSVPDASDTFNYVSGNSFATGTSGVYYDPNGVIVWGANALTSKSNVQGGLFQTATECLLGGATGTASPAACGSAASGAVAVPASQTTYTVNTSAVTANSVILLQQTTDNSGLPSSPTCGSTAENQIQSARTGGTSFTFTLGSVAQVSCFRYWIIN